MSMNVIEHRSTDEGIMYEISVEWGDIRGDFYLNQYLRDFYALFYNQGHLYFPQNDMFHAKTWETLRQHIMINLRDADFLMFIGFMNRSKMEKILQAVHDKFYELHEVRD